ncbi:MAG TPA: FAD:protein FMN transferase [Bacteroidetes bacterium]|nr:FAD:protein FMN transferase [Bacteroidota bacterium]
MGVQNNLFYRSFYAMGTRFEMVIPGSERKRLENFSRDMEEKVLWWHRHLSRFEPDSDISRVNLEASRHPVEVDEKIFFVLEECNRYVRDTHGLFDPAILAIQEFWKESRWSGDPQDVKKIASRSGWKQVILDPEKQTVFFKTKDTGIDPGAFGKGLALREAGNFLKNEGLENALLSFGGSSILGVGKHPHGPHWPVGITHIFAPYRNVYVFPLHDAALSSSGASLQRKPAGKEEYLPVFHPRTGMPVTGWKTVSVMTKDPLEAEILSTAFLVANETERDDILKTFAGISQSVEIIYLKQKENVRTFTNSLNTDDQNEKTGIKT